MIHVIIIQQKIIHEFIGIHIIDLFLIIDAIQHENKIVLYCRIIFMYRNILYQEGNL